MPILTNILSPVGTHLGLNVNVFVPPDELDISGMGYTSSQIDAYLIYQAENIERLNPDRSDMDIRGNDNPTAASAAAIKTLHDNYVYIDTNEDFTP